MSARRKLHLAFLEHLRVQAEREITRRPHYRTGQADAQYVSDLPDSDSIRVGCQVKLGANNVPRSSWYVTLGWGFSARIHYCWEDRTSKAEALRLMAKADAGAWSAEARKNDTESVSDEPIAKEPT